MTLGQISFLLMMSSLGSMLGCFLTGLLLDKIPRYRYLILAGDNIRRFVDLFLHFNISRLPDSDGGTPVFVPLQSQPGGNLLLRLHEGVWMIRRWLS